MAVDSDAFRDAEVYARQLLRHLPDQFRRSLLVTDRLASRFLDFAGQIPLVLMPLMRARDAVPGLTETLATGCGRFWANGLASAHGVTSTWR
jgi:hypothetical protein